jgi:hypothetical protein
MEICDDGEGPTLRELTATGLQRLDLLLDCQVPGSLTHAVGPSHLITVGIILHERGACAE